MSTSTDKSASTTIVLGDESDWGNPTKSQVRQQFDRSEAIVAIVWLSVAALVLLLLEIVFLPTRVTVANVSIPVPWTIVLAYLGNLVTSHTAKLWTGKQLVAAIPFFVWSAGVVGLLLWAAMMGDQAFGPWVRTILLIGAGVAGGVFPLLRMEKSSTHRSSAQSQQRY